MSGRKYGSGKYFFKKQVWDWINHLGWMELVLTNIVKREHDLSEISAYGFVRGLNDFKISFILLVLSSLNFLWIPTYIFQQVSTSSDINNTFLGNISTNLPLLKLIIYKGDDVIKRYTRYEGKHFSNSNTSKTFSCLYRTCIKNSNL